MNYTVTYFEESSVSGTYFEWKPLNLGKNASLLFASTTTITLVIHFLTCAFVFSSLRPRTMWSKHMDSISRPSSGVDLTGGQASDEGQGIKIDRNSESDNVLEDGLHQTDVKESSKNSTVSHANKRAHGSHNVPHFFDAPCQSRPSTWTKSPEHSVLEILSEQSMYVGVVHLRLVFIRGCFQATKDCYRLLLTLDKYHGQERSFERLAHLCVGRPPSIFYRFIQLFFNSCGTALFSDGNSVFSGCLLRQLNLAQVMPTTSSEMVSIWLLRAKYMLTDLM